MLITVPVLGIPEKRMALSVLHLNKEFEIDPFVELISSNAVRYLAKVNPLSTALSHPSKTTPLLNKLVDATLVQFKF